MAKRKGVNSRKRYLQRKKKVGGTVRKSTPLVLVVIVLMAGGYAVIKSGVFAPEKIMGMITHSPLFTVRAVKVHGNRIFTDANILSECGISLDAGAMRVNAADISGRLSANPWIEKVRCVRKFWGDMVIDIHERVPVAMINTGEVVLVDRNGCIMPLRPNTRYDLPMLSGMTVTRKNGRYADIDSARMAGITAFIDSVNRNDRTFFKTVPQFDIGSGRYIRGFAVVPRTTVLMDYQTDREQLENLRYMLSTLASRDEVPEYVNVQYQNLAFVTTKLK